MFERKCEKCGVWFGQSLDDFAGGDDTTAGLCENCRGDTSRPGVDSGVKTRATILLDPTGEGFGAVESTNGAEKVSNKGVNVK
jgi:hypothetical protein